MTRNPTSTTAMIGSISTAVRPVDGAADNLLDTTGHTPRQAQAHTSGVLPVRRDTPGHHVAHGLLRNQVEDSARPYENGSWMNRENVGDLLAFPAIARSKASRVWPAILKALS